MPVRRVETIRALAQAAAGDGTLFDCTGEMFSERLCRIPGMGPWTASYIAMRALGEPDAFPASDLGLRRGFAALNGDGLPTAAELENHSELWRPWRSYAAMHLWSASR
jgi:AraC family transcriptional regulator of adaptative response / DNA-3-methyladenine glycosylase II